MKKTLISFLLVLTIFCSTAFTEETVDTILFRDIPWLSTRAEVEMAMSDCQSGYGNHDMTTIQTWFEVYEYSNSDPCVSDGGAISAYKNVSVAGYTASAELSFIFPIVDDTIIYSADKALFYKAKYELNVSEDIPAIFDELTAKLSSIYGDSVDKSDYDWLSGKDSPKGRVWYAKDGSLVYLSMFYNIWTGDYDDIWITYAAPNANDLLTNLESKIEQDAEDARAAERAKNSENTSGL